MFGLVGMFGFTWDGVGFLLVLGLPALLMLGTVHLPGIWYLDVFGEG